MRTGFAMVKLDGVVAPVRAELDADRLAFTADVPAGSAIESIELTDDCGNTSP